LGDPISKTLHKNRAGGVTKVKVLSSSANVAKKKKRKILYNLLRDEVKTFQT
jgi:hypothetical protein